MDDILDVSDIFWQFVSDVNNMPYVDLSKTHAFEILSDHSSQGSYALSIKALGLTSETALCMLGGSEEDVYHDLVTGRFVFCDVTSLLRNTPRLVTDSDMRDMLKICLAKISNFVNVSDLAEELEQFANLC